MDKPVVQWADFYWESLRIEHLKDKCPECLAGGCLNTPKPEQGR
jgi:hypothetical protein